MEKFIPVISALTTGVITAVSTLTAVLLTQRGNTKNLKQQIIRDELKEKRNELKETLEVYNRVLKVNGEYLFHINNGQPFLEFNADIYNKEIRPIIYEKYHLLDNDIALIVGEIDDRIKKCVYYEEFTGEDNLILNSSYDSLIKKIKGHIASFNRQNKNVDE
ncbi:hypothetical protein ACH0CQ_06835 [Bacillus sp. 179-I 2A5 NHS]|uniref:hypothetical protein n=1 Tax=Bacillus sp. 179-I 2A5 NHS TaxID=3374300 RepID=UPI003879DBF8